MFLHQDWKFNASCPSNWLSKTYENLHLNISSDLKQLYHKTNDELFEIYSNTHDSKVRDEIILRNIPLVFNQSKKYLTQDYAIDGDDIVQTGIVGLIAAVDNFDPSKGIHFSTYASICIRNEILMIFRKFKYADNQVSIYSSYPDYPEITIEDMIEDPSADFSNSMNFISVVQLLQHCSYLIPKRRMEIIKYRFGIDCKPHTQRETSERFNVSQTTVCRDIKKGLGKIRDYMLDQI